MDWHAHKVSCSDCRLAGLCLTSGLKQDEISQLTSIVRNKRPINERGYLYRQGDHSQSLFAVRSGSFRSFILDADGVEQTIGFHLPGEFIGLDALHTGSFSCSVMALETALVCEIPLPSLNELANKVPRLQNRLIHIVGKEISSYQGQIVVGHQSAIEKIASFLLTLSRRYQVLGFSSTEFILTMRRQDIANYFGLTIETVSRQLAELNKNGIITVKQRCVQINELESLKAIAGRRR